MFGSLATYHCNPGYVLWGNASRLCGDDGLWTGINTPECKPITCGRPPEAPNALAHLVNGSTLWRSVARYECKPGFVVDSSSPASASASGSPVVLLSSCSVSGLWEPPPNGLRCRFDPDAAAGQIEGQQGSIVLVLVSFSLGISALMIIMGKRGLKYELYS